MSDLEDDLKATAEDIAADASELQDIEEEKARLEADDPRMPGLARRSERIVRRILPKATVQKELIDSAQDNGGGKAH
jgi:hypothetical protein